MTASDNNDTGPSNEERMAAFFGDTSGAEPPADYLDAWEKLADVDAKAAEIRELESAPGGDALALRARRQDLAQLRGEHVRLLALAMGHEPEPAPMTDTPPTWTLRKPQRDKGYTWALHRVLKGCLERREPRPTAKRVLDLWSSHQEHVIVKVLSDGFDYYDQRGEVKTCSLEVLRKSIDGLTSKP